MSSSIENTGYYLRIMSMYIDLGTKLVLRVFLWLMSTNGNMDTKTFFNKNNKSLSDLRKKGFLNTNEYNKLRTADPNPETFDITLLMKIIIHLFSNAVAVPSREPQPNDYSLGSELYRLRKYRNKLVHEPTSQITKDRFENFWKKISTVMKRVVQHIDPDTIEDIQNKLSRYKQMPLDPDDIAIKSKLEKLEEWGRERKRLKEETEDLLKKATGCQLLLKKPPIEYKRYIRLLFEGSRLVLTGILERECNNSSRQVNLVLEHYSETSSSKGTQQNTSSMDVALLASIILDTFKTSTTLSSEEIKRILCLRDARKMYADTALSFLGNGREYFQRWIDLIQSLTSLSASLGGTTQDHCNTIIELCTKMEDGEDSRTNMYLQQLQQHGTEVKSFAELYKENVDGLKQMLRQMTAEGERFSKAHAIEIKMELLCENTEKKNEAEDRLETVFNTAVNTSACDMAPGELMTEVVKFRQTISNHTDVEVREVERKCILLKLTCSSCEGVLHVLEYIESEGFHVTMDNIAEELAFIFGEAYAVRGHVTLESIYVISNDPRGNKTVREDGITLPIECSSTEGIEHVLTMLNDGETTNIVNDMAEILTQQLNEKISLTIYPDLKGFTDLFEDTDTDTSESGSLSCDHGREKPDSFENIIYEDEVSEAIAETLTAGTDSPGTKGSHECERKKSDKSKDIFQKDEVGWSIAEPLTAQIGTSESSRKYEEHIRRDTSDYTGDINKKDEESRRLSICLRKHRSHPETKDKTFAKVQIDDCPIRNTNQDSYRPNKEQMTIFKEKEGSEVLHTDESNPNEIKGAVETSADILRSKKQAEITEMTDRLYSQKFIFWAKAALGLQITKDALCHVIEKHMTEFVEWLSNGQKDHLHTSFLAKKILTAGRVKTDKEKWKFQSRCSKCCCMFKRILEHHTNKGHRSINWQCHHPSEQDSAPVWWVVAKMFMPGDNISCMGPQEADPLALFSLVMNCKLFSRLSYCTQEVIEVRNKLISSNTITEREMIVAMCKMKILLHNEMVQGTSTLALNDIEKLEQEPMLTRLSKENRKLVVQALQFKASSIEYDIKQQLSSGRSTEALEALEPELQKTKDKIVNENDFYLEEIEKVDKTNQRLKKLYNDECVKGQQLEKENVKFHRKLSEADQRVQCKVRELEDLNKELKQMKHITDLYNDECAKRENLEKDNARLRRKLLHEDDKVQRYIEMMERLTEEIKMMAHERDLAVSFKRDTMKNEVIGAKAGGTVDSLRVNKGLQKRPLFEDSKKEQRLQ